jgi:soluble lytic murein transglycosylase-like protein
MKMTLGVEISSKVLIIIFLAMSIDSIQQRMDSLDGYLNGIDARIEQQINEIESKNPFDQIFDAITNNEYLRGFRQDNLKRLPEDFDAYISDVSSEIGYSHNVDISPNLIKSIIKQESGFNPQAVSHAGAEGLMQLMPSTAKLVGVENTMNPYDNLRGGVTYLAQMLQRFDGNLAKALAAYNAGPEAIDKYNGIPPYKETKNYVENIMRDFLSREDYPRSVDMLG